MQLISELKIRNAQGDAVIQLLQGDLSAIPPAHQTDILVLSAFPGNYSATEGTLIRALQDKGLRVAELASHKQADLREQLSCWLSHPLSGTLQNKLNIKRILCFEPGQQIHASREVVGNIFRCINTFAFDEKNNVIAIPMVASGCQRARAGEMLPALLEAAIFWLENGLPLKCIKLVIYRETQIEMARNIFEQAREAYMHQLRGGESIEFSTEGFAGAGEEGSTEPGINEPAKSDLPDVETVAPKLIPTTASNPPAVETIKQELQYDYFISYAHTHADLVHSFVQKVKEINSGLQIFYDRDSIPPGGMWIRQLSSAIQKANKVLIFLSPDYDKSPVCWDEFQCAKLMEYNKKKQIIQTIYLYDYKDIEMPPIMGIYSYIDCREGDAAKLHASIEKLLESTV